MRAGTSNPAGFALALQCFHGRSLASDSNFLPALPLPPLADARNTLTTEALRAIAGLYYHAELEHAGIIAAAEALVAQRNRLAIRSPALSGKLEEFERRQIGWYTRAQRLALFARVFGLADGRDANFEFERLFLNLCAARVKAQAAGGLPPPTAARIPATPRRTDVMLQTLLRRAGADLLFNLNARRYGNTQVAGQLIAAQLRMAIDILAHPELEALLGSRGLWANLRALLGAQTPDLGRIVNRAQSGLRLLLWLSANISAFLGSGAAVIQPNDDALSGASQWLAASGFNLNFEELYIR